jgi:glutaredoxin
MKAKQLAPLAVALLCSAAGAQQMYKYVAPDGTVSYSDKPPPPTATKVEKKTLGSGGNSNDDLPFELANAAKNNPVTLYTSGTCAPCEQGRKMLNDRGIPFVEKTVNSNEEINQYSKQMGATQIPILMVGHSKLVNFIPEQWTGALNSAGYPANNQMPKSHKNPPAEPLIAAAKPATNPDAAPAPAPTPSATPAPAPPPANGQPGFHF